MRSLSGLISFLLMMATPIASHAANVTVAKTEDGSMMIVKLSGVLLDGDTERLAVALGKAAATGERISGIWLDSPGGNILEGVKLASVIHEIGMATVVAHDAECASACFLPFAAGSSRFASRQARIGIHSAINGNGQEDVSAMAATVVMARTATLYGVPASITGEMVNTAPSKISWLSEDQLVSMGVEVSGAAAGEVERPPQPGAADLQLLRTAPIPTTPVPAVVTRPEEAQPDPMGGYKSLLGTLLSGGCRAGICHWMSIESSDLLFNSQVKTVFTTEIKLWESDYLEGEDQMTRPRRYVKSLKSYVTCSRSEPSVIDGNDVDGWVQTKLAPGSQNAISDAAEAPLVLYWAACHAVRVDDIYATSISAQKLGYPSKPNGSLRQVRLAQPVSLSGLPHAPLAVKEDKPLFDLSELNKLFNPSVPGRAPASPDDD